MERFADELDLAQVRVDQATEFAIAEIRRRAKEGQGRQECIDCGCTIPQIRLTHVPNATRCVRCQDRHERPRERVSLC